MNDRYGLAHKFLVMLHPLWGDGYFFWAGVFFLYCGNKLVLFPPFHEWTFGTQCILIHLVDPYYKAFQDFSLFLITCYWISYNLFLYALPFSFSLCFCVVIFYCYLFFLIKAVLLAKKASFWTWQFFFTNALFPQDFGVIVNLKEFQGIRMLVISWNRMI